MWYDGFALSGLASTGWNESTDGMGHYFWCQQTGWRFCSEPHDATYSKRIGGTVISTVETASGPKKLKLKKEETETEPSVQTVSIDKNHNYYSIGPFIVTSDEEDATMSAEVVYTDSNETTQTKTIRGYEEDTNNIFLSGSMNKRVAPKWNEPFYLFIRKNQKPVVIKGLTIFGQSTRTTTAKVVKRYTYIYTTKARAGDGWCSGYNTQPMGITRDVTEENKEKVKIQSSVEVINKNIRITGDIIIKKVGKQNEPLGNARFKLIGNKSSLFKGNTQKGLTIYKVSKVKNKEFKYERLNNFIVNTIEFTTATTYATKYPGVVNNESTERIVNAKIWGTEIPNKSTYNQNGDWGSDSYDLNGNPVEGVEYLVLFNSGYGQSTHLITPDSGMIKIYNIPVYSDNYNYQLIETDNYNYGYTQPVVINDITVKEYLGIHPNEKDDFLDYKTDEYWKYAEERYMELQVDPWSDPDPNYALNSKEKSINLWEIPNNKETTELNIEKVDSADRSKKLPNVEFVLKSSVTNKYVRIKGFGTGDIGSDGFMSNARGTVKILDSSNIHQTVVMDYVDDITKATKFITDSDGKIKIENLVKKNNGKDITYTAIETYNPHYGYYNSTTVTWEGDNVTTGGVITPSKSTATAVATNQKNTGEFKVTKVDDMDESKKLSGVRFVLRSSAGSGNYVKIKATDGNNITTGTDGWATKIVGSAKVTDTDNISANKVIDYTSNIDEATVFETDSNGEIDIKNLLTSTNGKDQIKYKLEEIFNNNYGYLSDKNNYRNYKVVYKGDTLDTNGYFSLKNNMQVKITAKNHQEYIRLEGYVWEELSNSKNNTINDLYDNGTDALVEGINVYLYKNGNQIASTVTDSKGWYGFGTRKNNGEIYTIEDYTTESNGNLLIDDLDKYYIEFEYDGLRFTSVKAITDYLNNNYDNTSKGAEVISGRRDRFDRNSVNSDFARITFNNSYTSDNRMGYKLEYNQNKEKHESKYDDSKYWNYEYNENKTKLKVAKVENRDGNYEVRASTQTSRFNLKEAWNAKFKGKESITGVNLGMKRREQADLAISSDISQVDMIVKDYQNTYTYANRSDYQNENENDKYYDSAKDGFGVEVKFGNGANSYSNKGLNMYTRRIYESDLALLNDTNSSDNLVNMYITYKIKVKNQSSTLTSVANELTNYYDNRYERTEVWIEKNGERLDNLSLKGNSDQDGFSCVSIRTDTKIGPNESIDIFIKFRLKTESVKALMSRQTTLDNVTEITEFSTMTQTINGWSPYAAIDEDSRPGSMELAFAQNEVNKTTIGSENGRDYEIEKKQLNMESYEDDTDYAPSLILGIEEAEPTRGLSGTVFEDYTDSKTNVGKERLGDGILNEQDKNRIYNAKVELIEYPLADESKVATLYKLNLDKDTKELKTTTESAVTYTNEKGDYTFTGVLPGKYLIRYTYDDKCYILDKDTQYTITKENGATRAEDTVTVKKGDETLQPINTRDYKSTVIKSPTIKNALSIGENGERDRDPSWILTYDRGTERVGKNDTNGLIRYSSAVDDMSKRSETGDIYNGNYGKGIKDEMTADTAFFEVGVEYNAKNLGYSRKVDYTDYKDEYKMENGKILVLDDNYKIKLVDTFYAVNPYQDFGIVERPRQQYELNKRISNLKITLGNGQVLLSGNPYKQNPGETTMDNWEDIEKASDNPLPYVKALDGRVNVEIDSELIQQSTLNIEYTISILNTSEIDYDFRDDKGKNYYYYGDKVADMTKSSFAIAKVVDYMENGLVYDESQNTNWTKVDNIEKLTKWQDGDSVEKKLVSDDVYDTIKDGYTVAITTYFSDTGIEPGQVGEVKIYGNKVLSTQENGIKIKNHAEIIEISGIRSVYNSIPGNYNPKTELPNEPDSDRTELIITNPTGLTKNTIVIIPITVIVLLVLACGIYVIKKKVID